MTNYIYLSPSTFSFKNKTKQKKKQLAQVVFNYVSTFLTELTSWKANSMVSKSRSYDCPSLLKL